MTAILSREIHSAGHNHETSADHLSAAWWKPTSPTTPLSGPNTPPDPPARNVRVGVGGWAKVYVALDWRWKTPWPDDGIRRAVGGTDSHASGFILNFHNIAGDNHGIGWLWGNGVSAVAIYLSPNDNRFVAHVEHNAPTWEPALVMPAANVWDSLMVEVTPGRKDGDAARTAGVANKGRLRVWQKVAGVATLVLDSDTAFPGGINTLQYATNPSDGLKYIQQWYTIWQGGPYTGGSPLNLPATAGVNADMNIEMTAMRVGQTAADCLGDTPVANTSRDACTTYDSSQGPPSANGHGGDSWLTAPVTGVRTVEDFAVPAEFGGGGGSSPPANTVLPSISGTVAPGNTLTCADGTWSGSPAPTVKARQWLMSYDGGANLIELAGETGTTLALTAAKHTGVKIAVRVTYENTSGEASAVSALTAVVARGDGNWIGNPDLETNIDGWGGNQGTETLTRSTTVTH